jgi:phosphohistidine phosphatase SixA
VDERKLDDEGRKQYERALKVGRGINLHTSLLFVSPPCRPNQWLPAAGKIYDNTIVAAFLMSPRGPRRAPLAEPLKDMAALDGTRTVSEP